MVVAIFIGFIYLLRRRALYKCSNHKAKFFLDFFLYSRVYGLKNIFKSLRWIWWVICWSPSRLEIFLFLTFCACLTANTNLNKVFIFVLTRFKLSEINYRDSARSCPKCFYLLWTEFIWYENYWGVL